MRRENYIKTRRKIIYALIKTVITLCIIISLLIIINKIIVQIH